MTDAALFGWCFIGAALLCSGISYARSGYRAWRFDRELARYEKHYEETGEDPLGLF